MLRKIYVAGPYRNSTTWGIHCNIHRAKQYGLEIAKLGANPFIPHANTGYYDGEMPQQFWLDCDTDWLLACDALFLMPDSDSSIGAQSELEAAELAGIPVFRTLAGLNKWLQENY